MIQETSSTYRRLIEQYRDIDALEAAMSLLNWDRQVLMPPGGADARGKDVAILARMRHEMVTDDGFQKLVAQASAEVEPGSEEAAAIRVLQRELATQTKLPANLVSRKAQIGSDAYDAWRRAKPANDYAAMRPYLEQLFDINRETAELLGYQDHIYDPLIDLFEEGATYADAQRMFEAIKTPIVDLLKEIQERGAPVDDSMLHGDWDKPTLRNFAQHAAGIVGFDFESGRLDVANNAFCTHLSHGDVRMTTRPSDHLKGIVSSSLHEMGHGLYEQSSPARFEGTPLPGGISLAVHESQSRLWENIVGRSRGFWQRFLPDLQKAFPRLETLSAEGMYRAINKVEPTFVRVGADEVSYNLHILVRFELECEILTNKLDLKDLPDAWNAKYRDYLGITPPDDTNGCLQDVHWTRGMVGYFPTYTMGNLISYQMWARLKAEVGEIDPMDFAPVLNWLREKVYANAKLYVPRDLVQRVTGRPMEPGDFIQGLTAKYSEIYRL